MELYLSDYKQGSQKTKGLNIWNAVLMGCLRNQEKHMTERVQNDRIRLFFEFV